MMTSYPYRIEQDADGFFIVQFLDLEEAFTQGETLEEAHFNAEEVLNGILKCRLADNDVIPSPSQGNADDFLATPSPEVQAAILIRQARGERSLADVAKALNTSWPSALHLEDAKHWPNLRLLHKAAKVLGKKLVLSLE